MVVLGGGADEIGAPGEECSPLAAATTPAMDRLATEGRVGLVRTIPHGLAPGSDIGLISLLGFDPVKHFTGRGPMEAVGRNITPARGEVAFCCNLVTVVDGIMTDHAGGGIRTLEAESLLRAVNDACRDCGVRIVAGEGHRHIALVRDLETLDAVCTPPHDILGEPADEYRPHGGGSRRLVDYLDRANAVLAEHEVNKVRRDLGETPASALWLWGQGVTPIFPRFRHQYGIRGALVCDSEFGIGLAKLLGMTPIPLDIGLGAGPSEYERAGGSAIAALVDHDLVVIHLETPGMASLASDALAKRTALERIDARIVAPLAAHLAQEDRWRLLVAADHTLSTRRRTADAAPVPFVMSGTGVAAVVGAPNWCEETAARSDLRIERGFELMEYFLRL